jgi:7,8-dihydropterin-6-yl-methyl-4-(beta-D-ribofuranosyl)aminobenzene 5'-phosphate synthase
VSARISPLMWPLLALASPILVPKILLRNRVFKRNCIKAEQLNRQRIEQAYSLELPQLDFLELVVLVEQKAGPRYENDPGVSYLLRTNRGVLLFDVGFGPETSTLVHNAAKSRVGFSDVDAVAISHLHPDHMGGMAAHRSQSVKIPDELVGLKGKPCFLPDVAEAVDFEAEVVTKPKILAAGIGSTGPLVRSLFFLGMCEEQVLVALVRGKGLVVITSCGHPSLEVIFQMIRRLSNQPIYSVIGGFHFPITKSRFQRWGVQLQMLFGTGKPPWQRINDEDLNATIQQLNAAEPQKVFLSGHDTCEHSLKRLTSELEAEKAVLTAGRTYRL